MNEICTAPMSSVGRNLIYLTTALSEPNSGLCTLLLNEGIPRAYRGKKLRLKNILLFPLIFEEINYF